MACTESLIRGSVSGERCLFYKSRSLCGKFRLIPLDEVQTVSRQSPSLFSQPCRFRRAVKAASFPPGEAKGIVRIRPGFYKTVGAYRETPQSAPLGLPAPLSGALFSLPPLGVVLREAAKGVTPVTLGCYQSTNNTPSVSLCSTAPPSGSQDIIRKDHLYGDAEIIL